MFKQNSLPILLLIIITAALIYTNIVNAQPPSPHTKLTDKEWAMIEKSFNNGLDDAEQGQLRQAQDKVLRWLGESGLLENYIRFALSSGHAIGTNSRDVYMAEIVVIKGREQDNVLFGPPSGVAVPYKEEQNLFISMQWDQTPGSQSRNLSDNAILDAPPLSPDGDIITTSFVMYTSPGLDKQLELSEGGRTYWRSLVSFEVCCSSADVTLLSLRTGGNTNDAQRKNDELDVDDKIHQLTFEYTSGVYEDNRLVGIKTPKITVRYGLFRQELKPQETSGPIEEPLDTETGEDTSPLEPVVRFPQKGLDALPSVRFELGQNYPNPFNPETWIPYQLEATSDVEISIYSIDGHRIRTLRLGTQSSGEYIMRDKAAYWDGRSETGEHVSSGTYFYHLQAGDYAATRKMIILK